MVHLAIDGMWQVFKLQRSTPRNDFCRIAAKNGILLRLINTLYSLNEATRLASISGGGGFPSDGLVPRPRSGPLDASLVQAETSTYGIDQSDHFKSKHGVMDHLLPSGTQELSRASASHSPDSRFFALDPDRPHSSNTSVEASGSSKLTDSTLSDKGMTDRWKNDPFRTEFDPRLLRGTSSGNRTSIDRSPKLTEGGQSGFSAASTNQQENVRPLLSLLDKEPPSRHFSGQLEYVRHLTGLEKHESIMPLLHTSADKKTNGLEFLMAEFAGTRTDLVL